MQPETTEEISATPRVNLREWSVEVVAGPDKGKRISTQDALVCVGSDPANDLVLGDQTVSRRHVEIERTAAGLELRDLHSRNGTLVDERRCFHVTLQHGDRITLGKTKLLVKLKAKEVPVDCADERQFGELVGESEAMRVVFAQLRRVARERTPVLLEGETGTGKELAAQALHQNSPRSAGPFVPVDCPLASEVRGADELFGPSGAFATAHNGTLFLDEVAELSKPLQQLLTRVLETGELGSRRVDVRVVAATSHNLAEDVAQGLFRKDLFFRLNVLRVRMPALRTRRIDIPLLVKTLLPTMPAPLELSPGAMSLLEAYDWPGNVRELRNLLERGALLEASGNSGWLDFLAIAERRPRASLEEAISELPYHQAKDRLVSDFERHYFAAMLKACEWDVEATAKKTGLTVPTLYRLLKQNGLKPAELKQALTPRRS